MSATRPIVIIGTGHAGVQAAAALRDEGADGPIVLVGSERHAPYERPPLSKSFINGESDADSIKLRDPAFFERASIKLLLGERVTTIERAARRLQLSSGSVLPYSHLILATGSKNRRLPFDTAVSGVHSLRTLDDAIAIRDALTRAESVVVVGAGFIGMEFAAVAARGGRRVTVVELGARPLGRSATPTMAEFVRNSYGEMGVAFEFGARVEGIDTCEGRVAGVRTSNDSKLPADLMLVGVGALACDELALAAGLRCPNGIEVDEAMCTTDPDISAIGDCSWHPNRFSGSMIRLESVQNAVDQARVVAKRLSGKTAAYDAVPWFWSDLGDSRLQIAGLLDKCDQLVTRGNPDDGSFSLFGFSHGSLVCVESLNRPGEHLLAKRILAGRIPVTPGMAADASIDLKQLLKPVTA